MAVIPRLLAVCLFYSINLIAVIRYFDYDDRSGFGFYSKLILLTECFMMLGILTSDYLIPSLSFISRDILKISDRVSGMTLLALGNAIPDITTTYQSMKRNETSLALGELIGGVFFLLTVILGVVGIVSTVKFEPSTSPFADYPESCETYRESMQSHSYSREIFLQDMKIFLTMIVVSTLFLYDGRLFVWECLIMVVTYVACAAYMVSSHLNYGLENNSAVLNGDDHSSLRDIIYDNLSTITEENENSSLLGDNDHIVSPLTNENVNIRLFEAGIAERRKYIRRGIQRYMRTHYTGWVRMTLNDCLDLWEHSDMLKSQENLGKQDQDDIVDRTREIGSNEMDQTEISDTLSELPLPEQLPISKRIKRRSTSLTSNLERLEIPKIVYSDFSQGLVSDRFEQTATPAPVPIFSTPQPLHAPVFDGRPPTYRSLSYDHLGDIIQERNYRAVSDNRSELGEDLENMISRVSGTGREKKWYTASKFITYLIDAEVTLPISELITLLFSFPITLLLAILIPNDVFRSAVGDNSFITALQLSIAPMVFSFTLDNMFNIYWLSLVSIILLFSLLIFEAPLKDYQKHITSCFAFVLSLGGISFTVHLILDVLTSWADSFNLSPSVLGLTIFAWGNSIGDLVSNITFVQLGVIDVALGACFGSPLLYILFGIGIDGILVMLNKHGFRMPEKWYSLLFNCIQFKIDAHLISSSIGIIVAFFILIVGVPVNKWRLDFKVSILLLGLYVAVTVINIIFALKS